MCYKPPKIKITAKDVVFFIALTGSMLAVVSMLGLALKALGGIE